MVRIIGLGNIAFVEPLLIGDVPIFVSPITPVEIGKAATESGPHLARLYKRFSVGMISFYVLIVLRFRDGLLLKFPFVAVACDEPASLRGRRSNAAYRAQMKPIGIVCS